MFFPSYYQVPIAGDTVGWAAFQVDTKSQYNSWVNGPMRVKFLAQGNNNNTNVS